MNDVRLVGISIPFWDLVIVLVKVAIAAIPAMIILTFLGAAVMGIFAGLIN